MPVAEYLNDKWGKHSNRTPLGILPDGILHQHQFKVTHNIYKKVGVKKYFLSFEYLAVNFAPFCFTRVGLPKIQCTLFKLT